MDKIKKSEEKSEEYSDMTSRTDMTNRTDTIQGRTTPSSIIAAMSKKIIIGIIIIIGIAAVGLIYYLKIVGLGTTNAYQAVFLNSGQVYFGKLSGEVSLYPVLRDVFYLQIAQSPQSLQQGEAPPPNMSLVKLGSELHGPTDQMRINRNQILFIEDLRPDSRVVQLILQFKKGNP